MDTSLAGRTALITGGSMGLGRAMAETFYREGARVALLARRPDVLEAAVNEISTLPGGGEVAGFPCDVTDAGAIAAAHEGVRTRFGGVDILVNNAGHASAKPFMEISDEDWQADIDLKLMAAVRLTRLVWPHMQSNRWGRVINLLNTFAKTPEPRTAPTSVTRAAGMALTKVLSAEGAPDNILVNAMLIGFIKSDQVVRMHAASGEHITLEEFQERMGKRFPMGRIGEAQECANLALFLASEASSYITGCAINMDGGLCKVV